MKKIYNAASMFNEAQVRQRKLEGQNMRRELPDMETCNPIDFDTNNLVGVPTPKQIWDTDYNYVKESSYVICELDSLDHGMIMEMGVGIEQAKSSQPEKVIICVISDFRFHNKSSINQLSEFTINHFVYGAIFDKQLCDENRSYIAKSHDDAIQMIKNQELFYKTKDKKYLEENNKLDCKHIYDDGSMFIKQA